MNIDFDYTARDKPQHNYLAELGYLVLTKKRGAMMYRENVPTVMRYQILPKAFETATLWDGLVVSDIYVKKQSRYKHFFGKEPLFVKYQQENLPRLG